MLSRASLAPLSAAVRGMRHMSASAKVWVNKDTKVICQGFTGKQVGAQPSPALRAALSPSRGLDCARGGKLWSRFHPRRAPVAAAAQ